MIVQRIIFEVERGCMEEAVAILKAEDAAYPTFETRVLTPVFAPFDQVVSELKFDSLIALDAFWANWWDIRAAEFSQKFDHLITSSGRNEIWGVHEPVGLTSRGKYVNWRATKVNPGHFDEVCQLLSKERGTGNRYDILTSLYGPMQQVVMVLEMDSIDAYLQEWETWVREKATPEFWEAWHRAVGSGGENEVWRIA